MEANRSAFKTEKQREHEIQKVTTLETVQDRKPKRQFIVNVVPAFLTRSHSDAVITYNSYTHAVLKVSECRYDEVVNSKTGLLTNSKLFIKYKKLLLLYLI